jgi:hypothetical protein
MVFNDVCNKIEKDRINCCPNFNGDYTTWAAQFVKDKQPSVQQAMGTFSVTTNTDA